MDSAGNVYIADSGDNAIKEWNPTTQTLSTLVSSGLDHPMGVAVDGGGNVYIADSEDNAIKEWSAATQTVSTMVSSGLNDPTAVAVDGDGNVFIADDVENATGSAIEELPRAFVSTAPVTEESGAGGDALPPVLPATESLTGIFAPTSDQSWLTVGAIADGQVGFRFTANTASSPRTAQLTVLGQSITVNQAHLSGDAGQPNDQHHAKSATSVTLGSSAVTLNDTATLSGGDAESGTLTFTLYDNGGTEPVDTETVPVGGDGSYTTPTGYTLPASGTVTGIYQWDSSYSGDALNNPASDIDDSSEQVTVRQANPSIATTPTAASVTLLKDTAALSGGYDETGTLTFTLYFNGGSNPVDTEVVLVNGDGSYSTPTGYASPAFGTYQWDAVFSGDPNNSPASDLNGSNEQVTVTPATPVPSLGTTSLVEGPAAGSDSDIVVTGGAWAATANAPWLHTSATGTGDGVATLTFDANPGATRTGTLTIAGQTLTVTQAGSSYVAADPFTTLANGTTLNVLAAPAVSLPRDVAVDSAGNVYWTNFSSPVYEMWNAATQIVSPNFLGSSAEGYGVAVDSSDNVYIADTQHDEI